MSMTPAKETEHCREEFDGWDHVRVTTATPVTASKFAASLRKTRRRAKGDTNHCPRKTDRRQKCAAILNIVGTAQPRVARSVRESSASSDTTPGELPSVRRSARTGSRPVERTTADFYPVFGQRSGDRGENRGAIAGRSSDNSDGRNHLRASSPDTRSDFAPGGAA
jgi:hypothetical protein